MAIALCALLPIAGGALSALIRFSGKRQRNIFIGLVSLLTTIGVLIVVCLNIRGSITLFSIAPGFDCTLSCDGLSRMFAFLIAVLWPAASLYAFEYMEYEERTGNFFAFYTITYGFALLVAAAQNLFTLYIFYECLTISTLPLVEHGQNKESYRAGRTYLLYLIGGTSMGFAALMLVSGLSGGSTAFTAGGILPGSANAAITRTAYLLAFLGFGVKGAIFPLCRWLPKASVAPTPVTALLHAVAVVNAGVFSVARCAYYIFPQAVIAGSWAQYVPMLLSAVSVVYGAVRAFRETHLKRRLAWSTVSNLGYMLFALSLLSPDGLLAGSMHMLYHSLMKIALFFCAGAIMVKANKTDIHELRGAAKQMPFTFFAFTLAGAALTGVPPLIGFMSKYLIISAALKGSAWPQIVGAASLIVSAILTAFYIFTVVVPAYYSNGTVPGDKCDMGARMKIAVGFVLLLIVLASIFSHPTQLLIREILELV